MASVPGLIGEVFLIGCIYMIFDMLVDTSKVPFLAKIFTVACYAVAMFLVVRFILINLLPEIASIARMAF